MLPRTLAASSVLMAVILIQAAFPGEAAALFGKKAQLYTEPASGASVVFDNQKQKRRLLGKDTYCIREIIVDKAPVFGGFQCRVGFGQKHTLILSPGKHTISFDTASEWGTDPDLPQERFSMSIKVADADLVVTVKDGKDPEVSRWIPPVPDSIPATTTAGGTPPASTAPPAAGLPPEGGGDSFAKLEKLKRLFDMGIITKEEFEEKKKELLRSIR